MPTAAAEPDGRPWLVIVTGEPGSGKTTLGRALAGALRLPYLSRDDVRGGMLATAGLWTNQMGRPSPRETAIDAVAALVEAAAAFGISAVLELVVLPDRRPAFRRIEAACRCLLVVASSADAGDRAEARDRQDPFFNRPDVLAALGHASIDDFLAGDQGRVIREGIQTDLGLPTLAVATDDGYDPPLAEIADWIIDQTCRSAHLGGK